MPSVVTRRVTPEEYLEREREAEFRHEYREGEIVAMSEASRWHGRIVNNLAGELRQRLRNRKCYVYSTDLRLAARTARLYTYPDVIVTCGEEQYIDDQFDTLLNPVVLFEVLSDSTKAYDRGKKFQSYRTVESLRDYVLVAQDKIHVEHWTRQPNHEWTKTEFRNRADAIKFSSIDVELPLSEIYLKVDLPA
jgi:Uma2 family endonuclease